MTITANMMGAGTPPLQARTIVGGVVSGLIATGTTQADALALTIASNHHFVTVASGTGALLPAVFQAGDSINVFNAGANALLVYPNSGAAIGSGAANAALSVGANKAAKFVCLSATLWGAVNGA